MKCPTCNGLGDVPRDYEIASLETLDALTTAQLVALKRDGIVVTQGGRIIRIATNVEEALEKTLKKAFKK